MDYEYNIKEEEQEIDYFWFEKDNGRDFPLYNDQPFRLSWAKWIWWVAITIGSFFVFSGLLFEWLAQIFDQPGLLRDIVTIPGIDTIIMIITFILIFGIYTIVTKNHWSILFHIIRAKTWIFILILAAVGALSMAIIDTFILGDLFHIKTVSDAALDGSKGLSLYAGIRTFIQLIAEEFWTIVPFLFILTICTKGFSFSRKTSLIIAWILSSIIFGLYHLQSYDGNIIQAIILIGGARVFLTFAYIRYKTIWASYMTHVFWDSIPIISAVIAFYSV